MAKFVAYHRVKAAAGGDAFDELAAYRQRVVQLLGTDGRLIQEIIERSSQRGRYLHLRQAVRAARVHHAKLLVTGIQREDGFFHLTDQGTLCVVDVPEMGRSALRQFLLQKPAEERKKQDASIRSKSIKIGLENARSRGAKLGNPSARTLQPKASQAASTAAEEFRAKLRIRILEDHRDGLSLRAIAGKLNSDSIPTARGRSWHASSVSKILTEAREGTK